MPSFVPVTLKSISPRWSSSPRISERIAYFPVLESDISPIAIPATGFFSLMPESISASVPAHTVAIDDEPLDSRMSDTTLTAYGFSSPVGTIGLRALNARFPCPISLRPTPL